MDEFFETTQHAVVYLENALEHFSSFLTALEGSILLNQNEEFLEEIISRLQEVYDDIASEKDSCSDALDSIKEIVFDISE